MNKRINKLAHEVLNATGGIYWILKPYHKRGVLDDQHFMYVLSCLRKIETACKEYHAEYHKERERSRR